VPRFTLELSPVELDVVWRSQPFDELPLIIDVPSPGRTHAERATLEARVWTDLIERDLADDHGRPTVRVVETLGVIDRRLRSLELRTFGPEPIRAILAVHGARAVLALLDHERIRFAGVADTGLARTLLSLLPAHPAGAGHAISVAMTAFAAASKADNPSKAWDILHKHGTNRDDARTVVDMAIGGFRTGQIAAELRARSGQLVRSARVVAFHDTPRGRYRTLRKVTSSTDQLTIAPATPATLARDINDLLVELANPNHHAS
jgi:hypothetical protein